MSRTVEAKQFGQLTRCTENCKKERRQRVTTGDKERIGDRKKAVTQRERESEKEKERERAA